MTQLNKKYERSSLSASEVPTVDRLSDDTSELYSVPTYHCVSVCERECVNEFG